MKLWIICASCLETHHPWKMYSELRQHSEQGVLKYLVTFIQPSNRNPGKKTKWEEDIILHNELEYKVSFYLPTLKNPITLCRLFKCNIFSIISTQLSNSAMESFPFCCHKKKLILLFQFSHNITNNGSL